MQLRRLVLSPGAVWLVLLMTITGIVAVEVCRIPVQVSDSLGNLLQVQRQPLGKLFVEQFSNGAYVRPMLWAQTKLAYEASAGRETLVFKAIHVAQLLLLLLLVRRLMPVRSRSDLAAAVLAALVLFGIHTFDGLVREAFPINSFLTIALCVLGVVALADGESSPWRDVAAVGIFVFAILTLESGVLVAVAALAARIAGLRGISNKGTATVLLALAAYVLLRTAVLHVGAPSLTERASGFGFHVLEPGELQARFSANPLPFYTHNVIASLLTVLLAEPRGGVWYATQGVAAGDVWPPWLWINVAASLVAAILVLGALPGAAARWARRRATPHDQRLLIALLALVANAAVSFAYTKDVIMSVGGMCFAVAVYAAAASRLEAERRPSRGAVSVMVAVGIALWAVRGAALPARLEMQASRTQQEWRDVDGWLTRQHVAAETPEARALVNRLRRRALRARPLLIEWSGWWRAVDLN